MNKRTSISIGIAVAVVVLALVFFGGKGGKVDEEAIVARVMQKVVEIVKKFGAIPGTSVDSNCFSIGGVERCYYKATFATATSTYCAFKLPRATSTLVSFNARLDSSTSTVSMLVLATSSSPYAPLRVAAAASSSEISSLTVAAGTKPGFYVVPGTGAGGLAREGNATSTLNTILSATSTSDRTLYLVLYARGAGILDDSVLSAAHTGVCNAVVESFL